MAVKKICIITTKALVVLFIAMMVGWFLWAKLLPLEYLLATTSINRVEIDKRNLQSVVRDVVSQVAAKSGTKPMVIFSPERLGDNTRETTGGVFGNPPVEGIADEALATVASDFHCRLSYVGESTLLFTDGK